jgi:hypothetical protein
MSDSSNNSVEIHAEPLPFQQIPNWVLQSEISSHAIRLYLILQKFGHNKNKTSYWSRKKIAAVMNVSPATMDRAKIELIELGAICQINRFTEDQNWTSNLYHVHWQQVTGCKYLHKMPIGTPKFDETHPTGDDTPLFTGDELTNNHIELRTNELDTRTYGDENNQACNLLADLIETNGSRRPTVTDKWHSDMDKLNRIDERSWDQINRAIEWCQADDFWRGNIMSPAKLRKQYDQLRLAAQRNTKQSKFTKTMDWLKNLENETKELEQ